MFLDIRRLDFEPAGAVERTPEQEEVAMAYSDKWCNALYFPYGRRQFGGVFCRLDPGHDGDHWCEAEDEIDS